MQAFEVEDALVHVEKMLIHPIKKCLNLNRRKSKHEKQIFIVLHQLELPQRRARYIKGKNLHLKTSRDSSFDDGKT